MTGVFHHSVIHGLGSSFALKYRFYTRKTIKHAFSMFYLSNRPLVSMVYKLINHAGCW